MASTAFKAAVVALLFLFVSLGVSAQELSNRSFKDQWDKPIVFDDSVEWVIFSYNRSGGRWVGDILKALEITDPSEHHWLYVSDISEMPGMITRFIAKPKMQKYSYPIALAYEPEETKGWPRQEDKVAVYRLNNMSIEESHFFATQEALQTFLTALIKK
ncbi:MAG: hypothetical protein MI754_13615 [Chromatiales bacterium]|nr:hypothetical protein [Chromatiales bacterium]